MALDVSVVVATLDRARLLADTLRALATQVVPHGLAWEIVVVDNGSRDATQATVARAAAASPVAIRTVVEPSVGLSHARNRGILEARGSVIAFTDDDVIPSDDWVASIAAAMSRHRADVVGGRISPLWSREPPAWLLDRPRLLEGLAILDHPAPASLTWPPDGPARVWGANMAFRRTTFDTVGGFDPRLGLRGRRLYRGEETDVIRRALAAGLRVVYDPRITVVHRIQPERLRRGYFRRLAFDAGHQKARLAAGDGGRRLLGAPIRQYRLPLYVARWAAMWLARRPDAFDRELHWWFNLGRLTGHWSRTLATERRSGRAVPTL